MIAIEYTLTLVEPLLMTAPGGDPNMEESEGYVPGSAIRGALVRRFLARAGDQARLAHLFLNGHVRYLNAYPVDDTRALPVPRSWVMAKDPSNAEDKGRIYDRALEQDGPSLPKTPGLRFARVTDQGVLPVRPAFELAVHTSRNRVKGRAIDGDADSAVFRYRALRRGQQFGAAILIDPGPDHAETQTELLNLLEGGSLRLGGSQSAGYGWAKIEDVRSRSDWREIDGSLASIAAHSKFSVMLLSDAILRDPKTGQEGPALPDAVSARLGVALEPVATYMRMRRVGGFNVTWGLPLPQSWATTMGSLWVFEAPQAIELDRLRGLEWEGLGDRRAEGFGRVCITPGWGPSSLWLMPARDVRRLAERADVIPLSASSRALAEQMTRRIARRDLDRRVTIAAHRLAAEARGRLTKSQLARLRLRVRADQERADLTAFDAYLQDTERRRSANDQFSRVRLGQRSFRDWMRALAQDPSRVWPEILPDGAAWEPPKIGDVTVTHPDPQLSHHYVIRLIDAICEQLSKKASAQ